MSEQRNSAAVDVLVESCARAGVRRLVIVGASPACRRELTDRVRRRLAIRFVDGLQRVTRRDASSLLDWADLVVVCTASQLKHRVSRHFTRDPSMRGRVIFVGRRGIAAIATTARDHLRGQQSATAREGR